MWYIYYSFFLGNIWKLTLHTVLRKNQSFVVCFWSIPWNCFGMFLVLDQFKSDSWGNMLFYCNYLLYFRSGWWLFRHLFKVLPPPVVTGDYNIHAWMGVPGQCCFPAVMVCPALAPTVMVRVSLSTSTTILRVNVTFSLTRVQGRKVISWSSLFLIGPY